MSLILKFLGGIIIEIIVATKQIVKRKDKVYGMYSKSNLEQMINQNQRAKVFGMSCISYSYIDGVGLVADRVLSGSEGNREVLFINAIPDKFGEGFRLPEEIKEIHCEADAAKLFMRYMTYNQMMRALEKCVENGDYEHFKQNISRKYPQITKNFNISGVNVIKVSSESAYRKLSRSVFLHNVDLQYVESGEVLLERKAAKVKGEWFTQVVLGGILQIYKYHLNEWLPRQKAVDVSGNEQDSGAVGMKGVSRRELREDEVYALFDMLFDMCEGLVVEVDSPFDFYSKLILRLFQMTLDDVLTDLDMLWLHKVVRGVHSDYKSSSFGTHGSTKHAATVREYIKTVYDYIGGVSWSEAEFFDSIRNFTLLGCNPEDLLDAPFLYGREKTLIWMQQMISGLLEFGVDLQAEEGKEAKIGNLVHYFPVESIEEPYIEKLSALVNKSKDKEKNLENIYFVLRLLCGWYSGKIERDLTSYGNTNPKWRGKGSKWFTRFVGAVSRVYFYDWDLLSEEVETQTLFSMLQGYEELLTNTTENKLNRGVGQELFYRLERDLYGQGVEATIHELQRRWEGKVRDDLVSMLRAMSLGLEYEKGFKLPYYSVEQYYVDLLQDIKDNKVSNTVDISKYRKTHTLDKLVVSEVKNGWGFIKLAYSNL